MSVRDRRLWVIVGGVAAVILLFFLLRPSDDDEAATTTAPATTAPAETTTVTETETAPGVTVTETQPAETAPDVQRFAATLAGGAVVDGIQRWQVAEGDRVRIVVRSDVDDELHLHGYDLTKTVAPGAPAIFAFPATVPGRFELEAHHGGGQIAQLDVQP